MVARRTQFEALCRCELTESKNPLSAIFNPGNRPLTLRDVDRKY